MDRLTPRPDWQEIGRRYHIEEVTNPSTIESTGLLVEKLVNKVKELRDQNESKAKKRHKKAKRLTANLGEGLLSLLGNRRSKNMSVDIVKASQKMQRQSLMTMVSPRKQTRTNDSPTRKGINTISKIKIRRKNTTKFVSDSDISIPELKNQKSSHNGKQSQDEISEEDSLLN